MSTHRVDGGRPPGCLTGGKESTDVAHRLPTAFTALFRYEPLIGNQAGQHKPVPSRTPLSQTRGHALTSGAPVHAPKRRPTSPTDGARRIWRELNEGTHKSVRLPDGCAAWRTYQPYWLQR